MIRNIEIQKDTFHLDNHRRAIQPAGGRHRRTKKRGGEYELSPSAPHLHKSRSSASLSQDGPHFNIPGFVKAIADSRCNDPGV